MPLSKYERKERLPYGDQAKIAEELELSEATVSLVMNGKADGLLPETIERVQDAIAQRIGLPRSEVFAPANEVGSVT